MIVSVLCMYTGTPLYTVHYIVMQVQAELRAVTEERDRVATALQEHTVLVEKLRGNLDLSLKYFVLLLCMLGILCSGEHVHP